MNDDSLRRFIFLVFQQLSGAVIAALIHLGDRLGLYRALHTAGRPLTSEELAAALGLHERWVREWLYAQASAGLVAYEAPGKFFLTPEAGLVLAEENSPVFSAGAFHALPQQMRVVEHLPESFRTGIGLPYDAFGAEGAVGIERFLAPWFRSFLVPLVLPALEGVVPKLERGAKVADLGCGAGIALIEMARAFPRSEFHGYEISTYALARARENVERAGLTNVQLHAKRAEEIPPDASFDFVTSFDCIHDMTRPAEVMRAVRRALKEDGTWFIVDIHAQPTFEENRERNPLAAMMYGISVLSCLSSSLSEPGGAGLGTLGFCEPLAREMAVAAGFRTFRRHDFQNPVHAYYELRP